AITAADVGVVLNLAVWFALHTIFEEVFEFRAAPLRFDLPVLSSLSLPALLLTVAAMVAMFRFKAGALTVIAACGVAGLVLGVAPL
ncbi:MAG: chromate transporter, partial [Pseudomonas sp.]|nr:chromate transporter [Pseudomonas sp.]